MMIKGSRWQSAVLTCRCMCRPSKPPAQTVSNVTTRVLTGGMYSLNSSHSMG